MLIILPIIIFALLLIPFLGIVPYLDGNTEFIIASNFFQGKYLTNWIPYHPPLKPILSSLIFQLFGFNSYTQVGYILGIIGILALYQIAEKLYDKKVALLSSIMLAGSGLYVATGIFSLNDFLETIFILLAFMFYVKKREVLYPLFATAAMLTKETALLFTISIICVEAFKKKFNMFNLLPFLAFGAWIIYVHSIGHTMWNSWNFSDSPDQGSISTILNNILTGSIFNKYAYENWLHLFIFNFNWFFWILAILSLRKTKLKPELTIIAVFASLYTILILSFQTYTITRYILPVIPFVYLLAAVYLRQHKFYYFLVPLSILILSLSLFASVDPISNLIWNKRQVLQESFYSSPLDGKDGITYNMQFINISKTRNTLIQTGNCKPYSKTLDISPETLALFNLPQCQ